jgi:hypothetical protein
VSQPRNDLGEQLEPVAALIRDQDAQMLGLVSQRP